MDEIKISHRIFHGHTIELVKGKLLLIQGDKGMLGCGYFNVATADKLDSRLAVVTGVGSYDDMLNAEVKSVSAAAAKAGVRPGMSGQDALLVMEK